MTCGYLVPQGQSTTRPVGAYRIEVAANDEVAPERCPGCSEQTWGDLRQQAVVEGLHGLDEARDEFVAADRKMWWSATVDALALLTVVPALWFADFGPATVAGLGVGLSTHLVLGLAAHRRRRASRVQCEHPARWRYAPHPRGRARNVRDGVARLRPGGTLLRAPLTGRPCLAYEVALANHTDIDRQASDWQLIEQHIAPMAVGDEVLVTENVRLKLPRTRVKADAKRLASLRRRRGLPGSAEPTLVVESIVAPGALVRLHTHTGSGATLSPID